MTTALVDLGHGVCIEVTERGESPDVVLLPSADRAASDFARLASDLQEAGVGSLALSPRGVAGSVGPTDQLDLRSLAEDVAGVIDRIIGGPAHVVGHALGNTIARATAAYRPDVVRSVSLLACGGHDVARHPPSPEVMEAFGRCHQVELPRADRLAALSVAFFAPGNDPSAWLEGWYPEGRPVAAALGRSDWREWYLAGAAPVLILQPVHDQMAPVEVGRKLAADLGGRASYVELANCGHAILPEQPAAVARHLLDFFTHLGSA